MQVIKSFALALLLGLSGMAMAQDAPAPGQDIPAPEGVRTDFSDAELQSFIDVQDDLQTVRTDYTAKIEAAEDPAASAELQEEATQKMIEVVEASDLDVDTFNQIAMALQQDEELMARLQSMLEG